MLIYNLPLEEKINDLRQRLEAINKELLAAKVPLIAEYQNPLKRTIAATKEASNALEVVEWSIVELNRKLQTSPYYEQKAVHNVKA